MASGIFVSYRRDDTRHAAGRLADDLAPHFGAGNIFRDVEAIDPGVDFVLALEQALKSCVVMLVLIGPQWIDVRDAQGRRRLDSEHDWIRTEIGQALRRGIRVIPILVETALLPAEDSLPPELRALIRRQALELSDSRWRGDVQRLVETLAKLPGLRRLTMADSAAAATASPPLPPKPARSGKAPLGLGIAIGALGLLGVAAYLGERSAVDEPGFEPVANGASYPAPPKHVPDEQLVPEPLHDTPAPMSSVPALAGNWQGDNGLSYTVMQSGMQIAIVSYQNGAEVGRGQGLLQGTTLDVAMAAMFQGMGMVNLQCRMQAAASDFSGFTGICQAADGTQLPVHIFR